MCGALPERKAAMEAVIDSSYVPLKVGTILYSFWLSLNCLARSLTHSPFTAVMECHHWISVWAWLAKGAHRPSAAKANAERRFFIKTPGNWTCSWRVKLNGTV